MHFQSPFLGFENSEFKIFPNGGENNSNEENSDPRASKILKNLLQQYEIQAKAHYIYVSKKLPDADQKSEIYYE